MTRQHPFPLLKSDLSCCHQGANGLAFHIIISIQFAACHLGVVPFHMNLSSKSSLAISKSVLVSMNLDGIGLVGRLTRRCAGCLEKTHFVEGIHRHFQISVTCDMHALLLSGLLHGDGISLGDIVPCCHRCMVLQFQSIIFLFARGVASAVARRDHFALNA